MRHTDIEQFDLINAVRQFFVRRRRARYIETVRDNANAVFFADLAEQKRITDRAKRADSIHLIVFGTTDRRVSGVSW